MSIGVNSKKNQLDRVFVAKNFNGFPSEKVLFLLAETFRCLGDTTRVKIVWAVSMGEVSVNRIAELLAMSQPAVSHHLRVLRNLRLVKVRREGRVAHYSLDDDHIQHLLKEGLKHVEDLLQ